MAHLADLGGLSGILKLHPRIFGTASMSLTGAYNKTPVNAAHMGLGGTLTPTTDGSLVPLNGAEPATMVLKSQFNFLQITQSISTSQDPDDSKELLRPIQSDIAISHSVKRVTDESIIQTMFVAQEEAPALASNIEILQAVVAESGITIANPFEVAQALTFNLTLLRPLTSDFQINQGLSGFKQFPSGGTEPLPPVGGAPVDTQDCNSISRPSLFKIEEPISGDFIEMKYPIIGDIISVNSLTVNAESRGHVDLSFVPLLTNQFVLRRLTFQNVRTTIKNNYQSFLRSRAGLRMSITTPEGGIVFGYVSNLGATFTDQSININDPACLSADGAWEFELIFVEEVS